MIHVLIIHISTITQFLLKNHPKQRTHACSGVISHDFPVHLPVGPPEDINQEGPGGVSVGIQQRLERDAETQDENGQDQEKLE